MPMITTKSAIIFLIFSAFLLQHVSAADKTALLIANSDYGEHPLPEAKANVGKLAKVLEQAGFTVTVKENIEKGSHFRKELELSLIHISEPTRPY